MKRKRGNARCKPTNSPVVGSNEAVPNDSFLSAKDQTGLGDFDYAKIYSRLETETARADTHMSSWQADLEKHGAVNGRMESFSSSFREMIKSIICDLSKEAGGKTIKPSRGFDSSSNSPIGDASLFRHQCERIDKESRALHQDPRYKEQELKAALSLIKKIMKFDAAEPFSIPVDPMALGIPDYFDVIDTPMDFGTICNNLENGLKYMNSEDVYKDVQHIWENCCKYNKKGNRILELMNRVKMNFMNYWTAAGLYREQPHAIHESTMMNRKSRQESQVSPVTDNMSRSQVPTHPTVICGHAYQPQLSLRQADMNTSTADDEFSPLSPPTESTLKRSKHWKKCPVGPVTSNLVQQQQNKVGPDQVQVHQLSSARQPQLSSNQPQPSPQQESTMRCSTRNKKCPVAPAADKIGPSEVHSDLLSSLYKQSELNSQQPQPFLQHLDADSSTTGVSTEDTSATERTSATEDDEFLPLSPPTKSTMKRRQGRGPARCLKVLSKVGRIVVAIDTLGQPIGRDAPKLTSFLGIMARDGNLAPLTYASWNKVPDENKEKMWQKVQSKFDIDPKCKSWVLMSIGNRWRKFKHHLKVNHYNTHTTDAERLADRDDRVLPDQWSILVSQWDSEEWQNMSATNKANSAKRKFSHTTGRKSFARVCEEERKKRPAGKEPSQAELFILTHTRKDGQPVNDATAAVISQLRERSVQQQETLQNNTRPQDDIFFEVMGQGRSDSKRLYGLGPSPSDLRARTPTLADAMKMVSKANAEVHEMKDKMWSMNNTCELMSAQMATMISMMASMRKTSPDKHVPNVVFDTVDASEGLPQQAGRPSSSFRALPSRQLVRPRKKR